MKLHIVSDLHTELNDFQLDSIAKNADVIVLAGDIGKGSKAYDYAEEQVSIFNKPVIFLCGNHEYYGADFNEVRVALRERYSELKTGHPNRVFFLDDSEIILNNVRFLGSTLWTDLNLFYDIETVLKEAPTGLNDFMQIRNGTRKFTPMDAKELHTESLNWLESRLNSSFLGKTVVISHHTPSLLSVSKKYLSDPLSACFASNLDYLFGKCNLWIHGHTHDSFDYQVNGTRVICNPRGYTRFDKTTENSSFKSDLIVEI